MELEELLEKVDFLSLNLKEFQCCNCEKILLQPTQSTCGHLFCIGCIRIIFSSKGVGLCPVDKKELLETELFGNALIGLRVLQLIVKCPNNSSGCTYKCKLGEILQHLQNCEKLCANALEQAQSDCDTNKLANVEHKLPTCKTIFQMCPQGCRSQIKSDLLLTHLQTQCSYRHVECPHCDLSIILAELDNHKEDCDSFPIPCPYNCGIKMLPRLEMKIHSQVCTARLFRCKFSEIGCQFQDSDKNVWKHEQEVAYHLDLLLNYNLNHRVAVNVTLAELNANFQELKNNSLLLKDALDKNNDLMTAVKGFTTNLAEKVTAMKKYFKVHMQMERRMGNINIKNSDLLDVDVDELHIQQQLEDMSIAIKSMDDELQKAKLAAAAVEGTQKDHIDKINLQEIQLNQISKKQKTVRAHDGIFIWKIRDFSKLQKNAKTEQTQSVFSDSFYTHNFGYKMCLNVFPYGSGADKGKFLAVFIVLQKGSMDQILKWPFSGDITLTLLDQVDGSQNVALSFKSLPTADAFKRPQGTKQNPGYGFSRFMDLTQLACPAYLIDDTIYLKVVVNVTNE